MGKKNGKKLQFAFKKFPFYRPTQLSLACWKKTPLPRTRVKSSTTLGEELR